MGNLQHTRHDTAGRPASTLPGNVLRLGNAPPRCLLSQTVPLLLLAQGSEELVQIRRKAKVLPQPLVYYSYPTPLSQLQRAAGISSVYADAARAVVEGVCSRRLPVYRNGKRGREAMHP